MVILFTIGYTKKSLKEFVGLLTKEEVEKVVDVRLKNTSQLAGFAKEDDLRFILGHFMKVAYEHVPLLSPTEEIFETIKKKKDWELYVRMYTDLIRERKMDQVLKKAIGGYERVCLLCAEDSPKQCHRRLLAEYYQRIVGGVEIVHLTEKDARRLMK